MKLLEMGKDMKIHHSIFSPPTKIGKLFLQKKFCMGEQKFWDKSMEGYSTWGLIIRSYKGGR